MRHRNRLSKIDENILIVDPEREEMLKALAKLKKELPFLSRTVIEMHYEDDYTVESIAEKVGISVAKTKRIISKTKQFLRKKMEEEL
jgi:RNA polymerase sigma factor (sigma-70 family)